MADLRADFAPIGVLGGTFDPIHTGHLRLAIEVREALQLDCVRLIPLNTPNHREPPWASSEQRLEMVHAVADGRHLISDDREIRRGGVSYMVDTLASLRDSFPEQALCLIIGVDAFAGLEKWHRWRDVLDLAHLVVAERPDSPMQFSKGLETLLMHASCDDPDILRQHRAGRIYFQAIPLFPVSSTDIRDRLANGRDISGLVPQAVQHLIERFKLYRSSPK